MKNVVVVGSQWGDEGKGKILAHPKVNRARVTGEVCEELGVMLQAHVTSDTWQQVLCFYALNAIHVS